MLKVFNNVLYMENIFSMCKHRSIKWKLCLKFTDFQTYPCKVPESMEPSFWNQPPIGQLFLSSDPGPIVR